MSMAFDDSYMFELEQVWGDRWRSVELFVYTIVHLGGIEFGNVLEAVKRAKSMYMQTKAFSSCIYCVRAIINGTIV